MRAWSILLVAVLVVASAAAALAYPTLNGPTGLVTVPTADTAPLGAVDLAVDYQKTGLKGLGSSLDMYDPEDVKIIPIRAVAGVAPNAEVWAGYTKVSGDLDAKLWNGGAKYRFASEAKDKVDAAIGGSFGRLQNDEDINLSNAFLVLSKKLSTGSQKVGVKGHLGVLWLKVASPIDQTLIKPFIGVEITGDKGVSLVVEYRVKDSDIDSKAPFSAAVRYLVSEDLWIQAGMTNAALGGIGFDDQRFFGGLSYRFRAK